MRHYKSFLIMQRFAAEAWRELSERFLEVFRYPVDRVLNITLTPDGIIVVQNELDGRLRTWMIPSITTLRCLIYEATAGERGPRIYHQALRRRGLTYRGIIGEIYRRYGVRISESSISEWLRGIHSPYNGRRIPSLELLKPSEELAYVIGVKVGDRYTYRRRHTIKGYNDVKIGLKARDGGSSRSSLGVSQRFWAGNK
jgi:hypothetical protein